MEHETVRHESTGHAAAHGELFYQEPVFWVAVAFFIFMFLALRPLCRAIAKGLDARRALIDGELTEARRLREEAQEVLASYQKKQRDSLQEAEAMLATARADAARVMEKAEADLKLTLDKRMQMATAKIAQAEAKALQDMQGYVADIAVNAALKLVTEHLDKGGNDVLIRQAAADVAGKIH